jgi:hypothetical protein
VLPTYNSQAIEACLHRIPGLSEHYLYLNDDFLLGREVSPEDFFTPAGLAKVRLSPPAFMHDGPLGAEAIPTEWASRNVRELIERDFGLKVDRRAMHAPYAQRRSVLQEVETRYGEAVAATRAARFRSPTDLAIPSMLSLHLSIATRAGVAWPMAPHEYVYADTGRADWPARVDDMLRRRPKFICINATRHDEIPAVTQAQNIDRLLGQMFPYASTFEVS